MIFRLKKLELKRRNYQRKDNLKEYLSMMYLPKSERIFAIYNQYYWLLTAFSKSKTTATDPEFIMQSRKCGIFDLNTHKWTEIAPIEYERPYKRRFSYYHYELCANIYDENTIYAVSSTGNTQRYDFRKDKWYEIIKDGLGLRRNRRHIVWMDNINTICCGNGGEFYFAIFDTCDNEPKWKRLNHLNTKPNCVALDTDFVPIRGSSLYELL